MVTSTKIVKGQGAMKMEIREYRSSLGSIIITVNDFLSFYWHLLQRKGSHVGNRVYLKPFF